MYYMAAEGLCKIGAGVKSIIVDKKFSIKHKFVTSGSQLNKSPVGCVEYDSVFHYEV